MDYAECRYVLLDNTEKIFVVIRFKYHAKNIERMHIRASSYVDKVVGWI